MWDTHKKTLGDKWQAQMDKVGRAEDKSICAVGNVGGNCKTNARPAKKYGRQMKKQLDTTGRQGENRWKKTIGRHEGDKCETNRNK